MLRFTATGIGASCNSVTLMPVVICHDLVIIFGSNTS